MLSKFGCVLMLFLMPVAALPKNYGVRGPVYEISEESLLTLIHHRLSAMQQSGTLNKMPQIIQQAAQKRMQRPTPVQGISHATQSRQWVFDPTWQLSQSIVDLNGKLVAKQGQKINPLDWMQLPETLLFINADNKAEIAYTEQLLAKSNAIKIILTNGHIGNSVEHFKRPIYFDQRGLICQQFGILHTPATVKQNGRTLDIAEIAL